MELALPHAADPPVVPLSAPAAGTDRSVEELLVEACRTMAPELAAPDLVIDCDPPRLTVAASEAPRVARCAVRLLEAVLTGRPPLEIDLTAKLASVARPPLLLLSIRALGDEGGVAAESGLAELGRTRVARLAGEQTCATLVVSRPGAHEVRLSLALEIAAGCPTGRLQAPFGQPRPRVVIAEANPRARRAARRRLESAGYAVDEAARPLELVAQLDPVAHGGIAPAFVLLDERWIGRGPLGRRGLVDLVEASVESRRVVLLGDRSGRSSAAPAAWRRLERPFAAAELLALLEEEGEAIAGTSRPRGRIP